MNESRLAGVTIYWNRVGYILMAAGFAAFAVGLPLSRASHIKINLDRLTTN